MPKSWKIFSLIFIVVIGVGVFFVWHYRNSRNEISYGGASDMSLQEFYQTGQQLGQQNNDQPQTTTSTATFLAVGDIMLSRNVAAAIQHNNNNVDLPFAQMADVLKSTDFNFANLESPIAPGAPVVGGTAMTFGAPPADAQGLEDYNFKIINSANNHAWDQGLAGIDKTRAVLDSLGIAHEGTGDNLDEAWTPAVVTANGIKICFVGATYGTNSGGSTAAQYIAEISETGRLKTAIDQAKSECDFVVATMHAGIEYTATPTPQQIDFAHAAIDDGADIVIGAHPHWVQPIELYKGKYIFYSLGNFIFDQDFSQQTSEGLTLKITISKSIQTNSVVPGAATSDQLQGSQQSATLDSIELIPVVLINDSTPRPATGSEISEILGKINQSQIILK